MRGAVLGLTILTGLLHALPIPQVGNSTAIAEPRPLHIRKSTGQSNPLILHVVYDLVAEEGDSRTDSTTSTATDFYTCSSGTSSSAEELSFHTVSDESEAKKPVPEPEGFHLHLPALASK